MVTSVYQYYDGTGRILYVGVTARGIRRSHEHAESKEWWPLCAGCSFEHYDTRELALERERELIERFNPPYNTVYNARKEESMRQYHERGSSRPHVRYDAASVKERRREWYALPADQRRIAPCIKCGIRPGETGPECFMCTSTRTAARHYTG